MPSFFNYKNDIFQFKKKWWRPFKKDTTTAITTDSNNSSNTTLDWRSLSPNRPPLPFFAQQNDIDNNRQILDNNSLLSNTTLEIPIDKMKKLSNKRKASEPLFPIIEESETMITESSHSNITQVQQQLLQQQSNTTTISDTSSVTSVPSPPLVTNTVLNEDQPTKTIQKSPSDRFIPEDLIGNEKLCKRKLAKMVLAAYKYQKENQTDQPVQMNLIFDPEGNIDIMRLVKKNQQDGSLKSEYHKFVGNPQYVPPELSAATQVDHYQSEMADVWVLGIFLYRMLVGKYPFSATNDKQLFTKMLHADFSIPNDLSTDAKDLIKRMLAPDSSRASLDLIIHHPWLLSYRHLLLEQFNNTTTTMPKIPTHHQSNSIESETSIKKKPKKPKKKHVIKRAFLLVVYGPFPPPKRPYQDLSHLGTRETVFNKHL